MAKDCHSKGYTLYPPRTSRSLYRRSQRALNSTPSTSNCIAEDSCSTCGQMIQPCDKYYR